MHMIDKKNKNRIENCKAASKHFVQFIDNLINPQYQIKDIEVVNIGNIILGVRDDLEKDFNEIYLLPHLKEDCKRLKD